MLFRLSCIILIVATTFPGNTWATVRNVFISSNPSPMTINTATAGSQPNSVVNNSTTYSVETSANGQRVIGQLNQNMPTGITLALELEAPSSATSQGSVTLSTTAADLVTNIPFTLFPFSGLQMTYTLSATVLATPAPAQNITVTLTVL